MRPNNLSVWRGHALKQDDLNVFDWDLTDRDQGNLDTKMMAFMWFKEVTPMVRKRVQLDLQQYLTIQPLPFKGGMRATLGRNPVKRPWNKAQAIFIGVMREYATLPRDSLDIRWVDLGLRVLVAAPRSSSVTPTASFTIGTTWELNREKFQNFAPHVDVEAIQTFLSDA